jgi:hypothetical protein
MCKWQSDPEAQRKSSLLDCTWLENKYGSFILRPCTLENRGAYFILHTHTFFPFLIHIFSLFLLFLYFSFLSLFLSHQIFLFAPLLNSKIALYLPPPPCLDVAHPREKR